MKVRAFVLALMLGALPVTSFAQILVPGQSEDSKIRPPIRRPRPPIWRPMESVYKIRSVNLEAAVQDQVVKVRMSQVFQNTGSATVEAQFLFPIPADAAVSDLTLLYDGKELPGRLLSSEDARRIYEEIVRRRRDPALLEYLGQGLFQTSVFPIPAYAERTVEIRYTQLLKKNGGLVDCLLPLGTFKHTNHAIEKLSVRLRLETAEPLKTVYSPTHTVSIERPDEHHAICKITLDNVQSPDDLRILYGTHAGPVGMSLVSYRPKEKEDGYFMLLAGPELKPMAKVAPKTMVIVVDRSGSMSGEKIEQARQALKFFVRQLKPADTFNVIAFDSEVEAFRPELQRVTKDTTNAALSFADGLNAGGGTNIQGALQTALGMLKDDKRPSYVLFLTDGEPTVGEQNEMKLVEEARRADKVHARFFNLGIGYDVNSRLLDRLSRELNGQSAYVRPNESIETYVSALVKSIGAPILTNVDVKFEFDSPAAAGTAAPIARTYPRRLTDLFAGEQLVWVGRYRQSGPVKIVLSGELGGERQEFTLTGRLDEQSVGDTNGFVEKIWATRRIGEIIDEIDLNGKNQELIDELVHLSMKHGILTPYTSFLADERVDLAARDQMRSEADHSLDRLEQAEGQGGFAQRAFKKQAKAANQAPAFGQGMERDFAQSPAAALPAQGHSFAGRSFLAGEPTEKSGAAAKQTVQAIGQKTFYWKNDRWRDADVTGDEEQNAIHVKQFSDAYFALAAAEHGKFARYLGLDGPILVDLGGKTYLIEPAESK